jgi:hypothetical protein
MVLNLVDIQLPLRSPFKTSRAQPVRLSPHLFDEDDRIAAPAHKIDIVVALACQAQQQAMLHSKNARLFDHLICNLLRQRR